MTNWEKLDTSSKDDKHTRIELRVGKMTYFLYEKNVLSKGKNKGALKKKLVIFNYKCLSY